MAAAAWPGPPHSSRCQSSVASSGRRPPPATAWQLALALSVSPMCSAGSAAQPCRAQRWSARGLPRRRRRRAPRGPRPPKAGRHGGGEPGSQRRGPAPRGRRSAPVGRGERAAADSLTTVRRGSAPGVRDRARRSLRALPERVPAELSEPLSSEITIKSSMATGPAEPRASGERAAPAATTPGPAAGGTAATASPTPGLVPRRSRPLHSPAPPRPQRTRPAPSPAHLGAAARPGQGCVTEPGRNRAPFPSEEEKEREERAGEGWN